MRSKFPAYYRIHRDDILNSFDECIFMFDTSALLDVFRLKKEVAEKVFDVISHYKDQIRIPYHVAEEYNRHIHSVLKDQLNNIKNSQNAFDSFSKTFAAKRSMPYISKDTKDALDILKELIDKDYKTQKDYVTDQLLYGEYQNRMADLLDGKVLDSFTNEEIDKIKLDGATRYSNKVPPGYKDASKDDNRYGDLINWKEILRFAKGTEKNIIFVANDEKEDWVCKENGMTIGPLYDLLKEFYSEIGTNSRFFQIYTLDRFLALVNEKDNAVVSSDVVEEVKDYIENYELNREFNPIEIYSSAFLQNYELMKYPLGIAAFVEALLKSASSYREFAENMKATPSSFTECIKVSPRNLAKLPTVEAKELPTELAKSMDEKETTTDSDEPAKRDIPKSIEVGLEDEFQK